MTLESTSRFGRGLPIPFLLAALFCVSMALAGCATQPAGPVGPISSGNPRVDPQPGEVDLEDAGDEEEDMEPGEADGPFTPPHMQGRDLTRIGVMLPYSHPRESVREQAEGMLAAIELALFEHADENVVLIPTDTRGATGATEDAAKTLKKQGVDFVLGPLFGVNVTTAREALVSDGLFGLSSAEPIPVLAFSNDNNAAGKGAWLASLMPEEEVREIVSFAAGRGYDTFAYFGPQSSLGLRVEAAMRRQATSSGAFALPSSFYDPATQSPVAEARSFASAVSSAVRSGQRVAVLVPERGNRLRQIAPLLAYHGVDTRRVKMLGLSNWNDASIWREPSLSGGWFPAPPTSEVERFETRYQRQYGRAPSSLGAIAYDAASLAIALSSDGELTEAELMNQEGFLGLNGLFRFRPDGTAQRSLSIMEISPSSEAGAREIQSVKSSFRPKIG